MIRKKTHTIKVMSLYGQQRKNNFFLFFLFFLNILFLDFSVLSSMIKVIVSQDHAKNKYTNCNVDKHLN